MPQVTAAQELQIKAEARLSALMEEKLVTRISVLSTLLGGGKTTERLFVRISIETHKRKIGLSRRWAKLVATCLSKRTDNPASYEFGDISLQEVMAARLSGLGFRRRLGAGSVFMHDRGIVYQNLVPG